VYDLSCVLYICYFYFISSPFLFVYDDGRMIRYTGADVYTSDVEDTQAKE